VDRCVKGVSTGDKVRVQGGRAMTCILAYVVHITAVQLQQRCLESPIPVSSTSNSSQQASSALARLLRL
jgi:hypothetical protein